MRILALLGCLLLVASPLHAAPVSVPDGAVFYLGISVDGGKPETSGLGFVVAADPTPRLVSALHNVPGGAASEDLTSRVSIVATEAFGRQEAFKVTTAMGIAAADAETIETDVMVWELPTNKKGRLKSQLPLKPLVLAADCPRAGATVWLASPLIERGGRGAPGKVLRCDARTIEVRMDGAMGLTRSAGAPLLDRSGEVVGMLVRGEKPSGDATIVFGVSTIALQAHLAGEALAEVQTESVVGASTLEQVRAIARDPWANPWGLDLERIHNVLLPGWADDHISTGDVKKALDAAPALVAFFHKIAQLTFGDAMSSYDEVTRLLEEWSGVYAEEGVRIMVHAARVRSGFTFLTSWRLHSTVLDGRTVHLLARLDGQEVEETLISWTESGALVVSAARAQEIAIAHIWPALSPRSDHPRAHALWSELDEALGTSTMALLLTSSSRAEAGRNSVPADLEPAGEVALMNLVAHLTVLAVQAGAGGPTEDERQLWAAFLGREESHQIGAMIVCAAAGSHRPAKEVADELGVCEGTGDDVLERVHLTLGTLPQAELTGLPDALPIRVP
jgi:hypothetical protein